MSENLYCGRFIDLSDQPICLKSLSVEISSIDPRFTFDLHSVFYSDEPFGYIDIFRARTPEFERETEKMLAYIELQFANYGTLESVEYLKKAFSNAQSIVILRVYWPSFLPEQRAMFERLDLIWNWLFDQRDGIVQVDNGPFNDKNRTIF